MVRGAVILLLVCGGANAECRLEQESVMVAVLELTRCFHEQSVREDREYIAAIYQDGGRVLVKVLPGARGRDQVRIRVRRNGLLALWHTHGTHGAGRSLFSSADVAVANTLHVPFYLTDPSGTIRRLDPGAQTNMQRTRSVARFFGAMGTVVRFGRERHRAGIPD